MESSTRNPVAQKTFERARGHRLHLLGLVSDGGVHSHYRHLIALANAARDAGVDRDFRARVYRRPRLLAHWRARLSENLREGIEAERRKIVTVVGRYFAMDRDRRWDRTKKAWDAWSSDGARFADVRFRSVGTAVSSR